jgi:hypothetical protein
VPPDALTGLLVAPKTARHAFASAYPAGPGFIAPHRVARKIIVMHHSATHLNGTRHLMDRRTRGLALLCIIASLSGMLAWALDRPLLAAAFAAQAAIMGIGLSTAGQSK